MMPSTESPRADDGLPALVGLGANLDAPLERIRAVLPALASLSGVGIIRVSSLWRSAPVDCPPGSPDFVNAVALLTVAGDTDPEALLAALHALEAGAGRRRDARNAPRTLDLDLLLLGDLQRRAPDPVLPHPRGHHRAFVLVPAAELVPAMPWPGTGRTVGELAAALDPSETAALERIGPARALPCDRL
jgi:2-amino-4-hydroxy-6-hydroxymethyldihydropteridine diphosphokinase